MASPREKKKILCVVQSNKFRSPGISATDLIVPSTRSSDVIPTVLSSACNLVDGKIAAFIIVPFVSSPDDYEMTHILSTQ